MGTELGMLMAHVQHGMPKFVLPAGRSHKATAKSSWFVCLARCFLMSTHLCTSKQEKTTSPPSPPALHAFKMLSHPVIIKSFKYHMMKCFL